MTKTAAELGISQSCLHNWVRRIGSIEASYQKSLPRRARSCGEQGSGSLSSKLEVEILTIVSRFLAEVKPTPKRVHP